MKKKWLLMIKPTLSIILPTFNREDSLKHCIDSVLNQTCQDWELIISDDMSTDDTQKIVSLFTKKINKIIYHRNVVRIGLPANRNIAINIARGDLIFFIEDDMILEHNCVDTIVKSFNILNGKKINIGGIAPALIVNNRSHKKHVMDFGGCRKTNAALNVPCKINRFTGLRHLNFSPKFDKLQEVTDMHACSLYPRSILVEIGKYDSGTYKGNFLFEETDLNFRIRKKGYKLFFEPKAVLYHNTSNSGGCRVDTIRYGYFFILNYIRFVSKNYGIRSLYMIPLLLSFAIFVMMRTFFSNIREMNKY